MGRFITNCLILMFCCMPGFAMAQMDPSMIQLWFEESREGGKLTVTVNFLSEAEDLTVLEYNFEFLGDTDLAAVNIDNSKGEFLAVQNLPIPLATTTIDLDKSDPLNFIVRVFQVDQFITSREYKWKPSIDVATVAPIEPVKIQTPSLNKSQPSPPKKVESTPPANRKRAINDLGSSRGDAIEIQGLIIDETRSKLGRDFYEIFFRKWIPPQNAGDDFIITIKELPSFGRSARIVLEVNSQPLSQKALSPRIDIIELQANAGIREVRAHLSARSRLSRDLENEDTLGSGIY